MDVDFVEEVLAYIGAQADLEREQQRRARRGGNVEVVEVV